MSDKNRSDSEAEKPRHSLLETGGKTQDEVSEIKWPGHTWDATWIDEIEIKPIDITPGQGSLLGAPANPRGYQDEVKEAIETLSTASETIKSQLQKSTYGIGIKLHGLPVEKMKKFSLGSEEDASRTDDVTDQQVEEIRSALQESRRLGESSERRLEELRQRRP